MGGWHGDTDVGKGAYAYSERVCEEARCQALQVWLAVEG